MCRDLSLLDKIVFPTFDRSFSSGWYFRGRISHPSFTSFMEMKYLFLINKYIVR